ncbi:hypothetical protein PVL29_019999 [Vitis rotundifolia]|uniref:Uncharacterized protein n=1 Tax=Vitis rotundifolia TaxID=103349 RepID=A0AA38Z244_VITRO|nr:hypothetical protein PVL29_019999 [Vitis rotundifolia]
MTDAFDPNNQEHQKIKAEIEIGDGLPDIRLTRQCLEALKQAGFEERDLHTHVFLLGSKTKLRQAVMWQLDPITCCRYQIKNSLSELGIDRSRLTFGV